VTQQAGRGCVPQSSLPRDSPGSCLVADSIRSSSHTVQEQPHPYLSSLTAVVLWGSGFL
jgi:hypothetical protein